MVSMAYARGAAGVACGGPESQVPDGMLRHAAWMADLGGLTGLPATTVLEAVPRSKASPGDHGSGTF